MSSTSKHPKALPYLFLTELWERFGYYLMLGIFVLYLTDADKGGFAIDSKIADDVFGTFIAFTYLTPFIGGFIADKALGYIKSIYIGGVLMGLGYIGLAVPDINIFYASVGLIVIGNGFFKPSISTLLGNLYSTDEYRENKDAGYNIFYMGINIGAFVCNIIAAFMRNKYSWGAAFITAGIGMFVGLIIFTMALKHVRSANVIKKAEKGDSAIKDLLLKVFLPVIACGVIGWYIKGDGDIFGSNSTDAFIAACIPVLIFFGSIYKKSAVNEKKPIAALLAIFAVSMMFWAVFKQNGTALTRWAKFYTNRTVSASTENTLKPIYMVETVKTGVQSNTQFDNQYNVIKDSITKKPVKAISADIYFRNSPNQNDVSKPSISTINTELFQSINPGWVIILTPLVVLFFAFLKRRGKEPTTPAKIALGLFISALSTLVMVWAVYKGNNGAMKVSALWLVASYGVITIGELCLSPMGLSLVSKLSPPRITALMMGGFFLSTSIGNKLSGVLASTWYSYENKANYFLVNCVLLLASAIIAAILLPWLNKIFREYMK
jgi:proton-dependent oligopeptide transporter, POT family